MVICISITNIGDSQLAKALTSAVGDQFSFYLHFRYEELLENYGDVTHKHGCDTPYLLMQGNSFSAFISFSSPPNKDQIYNLTLTTFFNDIEVPTIEIQHGLFQYGINNLDRSLRCGFDAKGGGWGMPFKYPAKHLITWAGDNRIGYLKSILPTRDIDEIVEPGYVLVTTNFNWHIYDDYDRYALVNAILSLVVRYPEERFVWKPHGSEWVQVFQPIFDMVFAQQLSNLRIFTPEEVQSIFAEDLIRGCKMGISTVSTALLDYQIAQKPVLVYERPAVKHMIDAIEAVTFSGSKDLLSGFNSVLSNLSGFRVNTGVKPLDVQKLAFHLKSAIKEPLNKFSSKSVEYLRYFEALNKPITPLVSQSPVNEEQLVKNILKSIIKPNANYSIEDILRSIENRIDIRNNEIYAKILLDFQNVLRLLENRMDNHTVELRHEIQALKNQLTTADEANLRAVEFRIDAGKDELYLNILQDFQNVLRLLEDRIDYRKDELQNIIYDAVQVFKGNIDALNCQVQNNQVNVFDEIAQKEDLT